VWQVNTFEYAEYVKDLMSEPFLVTATVGA